ncbi:hypothetical protein QEG98_09715 [Myxococcus sp. MxC21-1]|uniref:hypothetical protein n=1 Tax=Myxococcus sp. MxC21-1 TaxID=3041439 RepID=UPI00292F95F1|nr:hypothetical protein [Myxococcus sp. MxC21-1]WNZ63937.1 hypothetical protein QEG98_09715 [Myxococcus sp. MxC21-1]
MENLLQGLLVLEVPYQLVDGYRTAAHVWGDVASGAQGEKGEPEAQKPDAGVMSRQAARQDDSGIVVDGRMHDVLWRMASDFVCCFDVTGDVIGRRA